MESSTLLERQIRTNTHLSGVLEKPKKGKPLGANGKNNGKRISKESEKIAAKLPAGVLSVGALVSTEEDRIHIFHWPTMVYIGFDIKENEEHYLNDYLIMHYLPKMKNGFGQKLTIDAPGKSEVVAYERDRSLKTNV